MTDSTDPAIRDWGPWRFRFGIAAEFRRPRSRPLRLRSARSDHPGNGGADRRGRRSYVVLRDSTGPRPGDDFDTRCEYLLLAFSEQQAKPFGQQHAKQSSSATPGGGGLPTAAAVPANVAVVPLRPDANSDRCLYLVDTDDKIKPVQLQAAPGDNSNPMMPPARNTIIYLNAGALRVMASDASGDRKLFSQYPAGCDEVTHASWSQTNPNLMVISCRHRGERDAMLVIGVDGKLVRRLDAGKDFIGDLSLSPDGQTIAFWATNQKNAAGGSLFTLPVIGTGNPKRLANGQDGLNSQQAWSPDGSQIAVSRQVSKTTMTSSSSTWTGPIAK